MSYDYREYQHRNRDELKRLVGEGKRRLLYVAGTGAGKTVVATMVIKGAYDKGRSVLFVAHRRELIRQAREKIARADLESGALMAGYRPSVLRQIQVGSIQTINSRYIENDKLRPPDVIIIDEAHRSLARSYLKLIEKYPDAVVLGLTATPVRSDGKGLGHVYEDMVMAPTVKELIAMGFLVPPRYFTGVTPDLTGVRTSGYDFHRADLEERVNVPELIGDCVENWLKHARGRKTFVFASGVKHSIALRDAYLAAGVRAAHVDGDTAKDERDAALEKLESGELEVLTNCMVYTEGVDCPPVSCVQIAAPTKSIGKYIQMAGRALRPCPEIGKESCLILDHAGAVIRHGFVDDPIPWSLDADGSIQERIQKRDAATPKEFTCKECGAIFRSRIRCPECGTRVTINGEPVEVLDGELVEMRRGQSKPAKKVYTMDEKRQFYRELLGYCQGMGHKGQKRAPGFAAHTYRAKFGVWPSGMRDEGPLEPGPITLSYIRSRMIAYAKRKSKAS